MMATEKIKPDMPHNLIMEGRTKLSVSGVEEVESFNEASIVVHTTKGTLIVSGGELHIEKLSLDGGDLSIEGRIDGLRYEETAKEKGNLFSRLFK